MSGRKLQVRMLVGLGEDDTLPLVAGCIDAGMIDVTPAEETDAQFRAMKVPFEDHYRYEWREVAVTLDADALLAHFAGPVLTGEVEAA